jgi:hypothetical protein
VGLIFPCQSIAITIFIDGMNTGISTNELNPLDSNVHARDSSYLMDSELGRELKKKDNKQEYINWNGSVAGEYQTNIAANNLYDRIKALKSDPKTIDEPINIVSHSYGTVIAYNALDKLNNDPLTKNIKINTLTTMGSPLGKQDWLDLKNRINKIFIKEKIGDKIGELAAADFKAIGLVKGPYKLSNVKEWTNLWANNNNISGKINIPGVKNVQVDKDVKNHGTWYSQNVEKTMPDGTKKVTNFKSISIWHAAYYTPIENLKLKSTGEVRNWNLPKDYANPNYSRKVLKNA